MISIISRCIICGEFFDSNKQLRDHKDKNHRITDAKMMSVVIPPEITTIKHAAAPVKKHPQEDYV